MGGVVEVAYVRYIAHWIPPTRIELVPLAPEANALSAELRGLTKITIADFTLFHKSGMAFKRSNCSRAVEL